jgi:hypothetical protein
MNKRIFATLLALPFAISTAYAQDAGSAPTVKISGFGTGALTMTNTDDARRKMPARASTRTSACKPTSRSTTGFR